MTDGDGIDRHVEEHLPYIEREIRRRAGGVVLDKESVSDIRQSIAREIIEENSGFEYRSETQFKAWLARVVDSKIKDKYRYHTAKKRTCVRSANP